jgi:hypothetical protein
MNGLGRDAVSGCWSDAAGAVRQQVTAAATLPGDPGTLQVPSGCSRWQSRRALQPGKMVILRHPPVAFPRSRTRLLMKGDRCPEIALKSNIARQPNCDSDSSSDSGNRAACGATCSIPGRRANATIGRRRVLVSELGGPMQVDPGRCREPKSRRVYAPFCAFASSLSSRMTPNAFCVR